MAYSVFLSISWSGVHSRPQLVFTSHPLRKFGHIFSVVTKWISDFLEHQVWFFFLSFSLPAFLTGAPLNTIHIYYLFHTFRWATNDNNGLFGKVFLEWRLALRKPIRSILFKFIQSFSLFILHFMHCVQMIIYLRFWHFHSWWIRLMIRYCGYQPNLRGELLQPRIGQRVAVRFQ